MMMYQKKEIRMNLGLNLVWSVSGLREYMRSAFLNMGIKLYSEGIHLTVPRIA